MQLSERDKKLLFVLLIAAIIAIPYFLVIRPTLDKSATLKKEVEELNKELTYQKKLAEQEAAYQSATEDMAQQGEAILEKFPSELLQEASILFLNDTEEKIPISLYQGSFGDDVAAQLTSDAEAKAISDVEKETGDVTDSSVIEDNTQSVRLPGDMTAYRTESRFTYTAGYEEFKNFLKYIQDSKDRMVISSLDASYSAELERVSGNFTLFQYAMKGADRAPVEVTEPTTLHGTTNVFKAAAGNFGEGEGEEEEQEEPADFFILLNQPGADVDSLIIGKSGDVTENSYFVSSVNDRQKVTITFTGEAGEYNANYKIGKSKYGDDGVDFTKDGSIILQVISSPKLDDKDKVGIELTVENDTDQSVMVQVRNDEEGEGRVVISGRSGDVVMLD